MSKYRLVWIVGVFILGLPIMFPFAAVSAKSIQINIPFGDHDKNLRTAIELYSPINRDVEIGDAVTWTNGDKVQHTVTSGTGVGLYGFAGGKIEGKPDGRFSSGIIEPGSYWSFTFKQSGYFTYFCEIHPWIERSITVREPGFDISNNFRITYAMLLTVLLFGALVASAIIIITRRKRQKNNQ